MTFPRSAPALISLCLVLFLSFLPQSYLSAQQRPLIKPGKGIAIGIEYCLLDTPQSIKNKAPIYGELKIPAAKHYAEHVQWSEMQSAPDQPINFTRLDAFVREYQKNGFSTLTVCLKPHSPWASIDPGFSKLMINLKNASPKPKYIPAYRKWIQSVVERYDHDGKDDMPGLRAPIVYLEIGSEFSTYQPEPVKEYLNTLKHAYQAAHAASSKIQVAHAAFLTTPVDFSRAKHPRDYQKVFNSTKMHDSTHGIADMRAVLDHPKYFDVINIHPLGDPYEIEHIMRWLNYEMKQRRYHKNVIISDTINTSYIAWGPATTCQGNRQHLGTLIPPATEKDRCKLANYFTKLVDKDKKTLQWTRAFVAADHVKRTLIAAEQNIKVIHLSFTTDLPILTTKFARAGAGISAWGGMVRQNFFHQIVERYPNFYSIQQMGNHIVGYDSIERIAHKNKMIRIYKLQKKNKTVWVCWLNPGKILLPNDRVPHQKAKLKVNRSRLFYESVITKMKQTAPNRKAITAKDGFLQLDLTPTPIYVYTK